MPRPLRWLRAQALQGRDSWSPLAHFLNLRVTHFHSIKGSEPVLGWELAPPVVGDCAGLPLWGQSGEGSVAPPGWGSKLSLRGQWERVTGRGS